MMPIFGDPTSFAVEYEMSEEPHREWMYGRVCYWCKGSRVGDFSSETSLRDVLFQLERMGCDDGQRASDRFDSAPALEVFRLLDGALYGPERPELAIDPEVVESEQWARHKIIPELDVFDDWKGFLVETGRGDRLLLSQGPHSDVVEVVIESGKVGKAMAAACRSLAARYDGFLSEPG